MQYHHCGERYDPRHPRDCYYCRLALDNAAKRAIDRSKEQGRVAGKEQAAAAGGPSQ
jgi:hypothetical protein